MKGSPEELEDGELGRGTTLEGRDEAITHDTATLGAYSFEVKERLTEDSLGGEGFEEGATHVLTCGNFKARLFEAADWPIMKLDPRVPVHERVSMAAGRPADDGEVRGVNGAVGKATGQTRGPRTGCCAGQRVGESWYEDSQGNEDALQQFVESGPSRVLNPVPRLYPWPCHMLWSLSRRAYGHRELQAEIDAVAREADICPLHIAPDALLRNMPHLHEVIKEDLRL
ncbi:hypothetical protein QBC34DRAFT_421277 [Podospora aff. communis PSN243]|uniref:Uncharacterized protein n=1 Tax=Podospora aff. communis PSN243 TaxID=3040156 RepID=A0AAV9H0X9_9PEZI|nr:hypothetical protein QBC34DRAFT_421277 [Podospora aff. communis PSN243]